MKRTLCLLAVSLLGAGIVAPTHAETPGDDGMKQLGESYLSNAANVTVVTPTPGATTGTIYYVSPTGNDANNGTSTSTPWQTLGKVNATTFQPGDMILFQAGSSWAPSSTTTPWVLHPLGSGTATAPIVIGAYGSGTKPQFSGANIAVPYTFYDGTTHYASDVLALFNQQYVEIRDLDISNSPATKIDCRGIHIMGGNNTATTVLQGINIHDCYVHDINGEIETISGTGWDPAKRTCGILFESVVMGANNVPVSGNPVSVTGYQPTYFSHCTVQNNVIARGSYGGLIIKQLQAWGLRGSGSAPAYYQTGWYPEINLTIAHNYLDQNNDSTAACAILGIGVGNSSSPSLVTHNVISGAGTSACEFDTSDSITIEWNEIYGTVVKSTGSDSNAIDTDLKTTNCLIQCNYLHNNNQGILLCGTNYGSSVYRYNVIQDCASMYVNVHGQTGYNYMYNNVFYNTGATAQTFINSSGGSSYLSEANDFEYFYNNIFFSPNVASTIDTGSSLTFDNNDYYTVGSLPSGDGKAKTANPQFANPTGVTGGAGTSVNLTGLQLQSVSSLIGAGDVITAHPNTTVPVAPMFDIGGTTVSTTSVDLGVWVYASVPPPAPAGLTATAVSASQVNLSWASSSGATSYNVLRSLTSGGPYASVATSVTTTNYSDTSVTATTTYYYVVQAVNGAGTSGNSNEASVTTPAPSAPATPTGLTATAGNAQVALSWAASSGATSYNVKRATTSGGPYATIASPTTTSYTDTAVANGTTYYYVVSAVNSIGESVNSTEVSATPAVASQITASATLGGTNVSSGKYTLPTVATSATFNMNGGNCVVLCVTSQMYASTDVTSATYAGQTMTLGVSTQQGVQWSGIFYLINPTTTSGQFVIKTTSASNTGDYSYSAIALADVGTVASTAKVANTATGGTISLTYSTAKSGGFVVGACVNNAYSSSRPPPSFVSGNANTALWGPYLDTVGTSGHLHTCGAVAASGSHTDVYGNPVQRNAYVTVAFDVQ